MKLIGVLLGVALSLLSCSVRNDENLISEIAHASCDVVATVDAVDGSSSAIFILGGERKFYGNKSQCLKGRPMDWLIAMVTPGQWTLSASQKSTLASCNC